MKGGAWSLWMLGLISNTAAVNFTRVISGSWKSRVAFESWLVTKLSLCIQGIRGRKRARET